MHAKVNSQPLKVDRMNQNLYMNICPYEVEKTLKLFDMLKTK